MCSLSSGFIQIRSISRIRTFSSPCLTVPVLAFSICWLPERFGIYIITDHFLKLVQVSPQRNTAVNVWDLQVSLLNLKVNVEETLPNSVTSPESLLKNYFYRLSFYSLLCSHVMFLFIILSLLLFFLSVLILCNFCRSYCLYSFLFVLIHVDILCFNLFLSLSFFLFGVYSVSSSSWVSWVFLQSVKASCCNCTIN